MSAAWMATSASATPVRMPTVADNRGGPSPTTCASVGASTYSKATQGVGPSGSASTIAAVIGLATRRAASISRANRTRNGGPRGEPP
jgi:hypothetical protein